MDRNEDASEIQTLQRRGLYNPQELYFAERIGLTDFTYNRKNISILIKLWTT